MGSITGREGTVRFHSLRRHYPGQVHRVIAAGDGSGQAQAISQPLEELPQKRHRWCPRAPYRSTPPAGPGPVHNRIVEVSAGAVAMQTELVDVEIADHVALVTMNAPPVNAQNAQFHVELTWVFDHLGDVDEVRAVVLTGAGRIFSAGADIKARAAQTPEAGDRWQHGRRVRECFHAVRECTKPVVAAVNGPALGAGLALAASCDILVAAEEASFGLPEIDVGLLGGARHAMRLFGHSRLRRMMLTGMRVPGQELARLGVVEACVPREQVVDEAMAIAREIAAKSPAAVGLAKHALNVIEDLSLRDGYRFEQDMTARLSEHPDSREAMAAFLEKRPPRLDRKSVV